MAPTPVPVWFCVKIPGTLTATGYGPMSAKRVLKIKVERSGFNGSPGAIYLAADDVNSAFRGNAFEISGDDPLAFHTVARLRSPDTEPADAKIR